MLADLPQQSHVTICNNNWSPCFQEKMSGEIGVLKIFISRKASLSSLKLQQFPQSFEG